MATSTTGEEETNVPGSPGPTPEEVYNPLDYHTSDSDISSSTIDYDIQLAMTKIMWSSLISPQCSPIVHDQLHKFRLTLAWDDPLRDSSTTLVREVVITMSMAAPIQRNGFNPATAQQNDSGEYSWFMWLSQDQYRQFSRKGDKQGTVPGYKDTREDNVHKHH
eukprot:5206477-Amphidinium_carterae.1